ncbi:MAG: helix-turn-helix transcriptional regulator [Marinicaulis sp.]|nr:helix-turn-helix domain-containing protein [Marinicaulis sp.]NNE41408.1 helix-turn-helix transcriptional regulator [Marinicaulis sp.]
MSVSSDSQLGARLRSLRKAANVSATELAEMVGSRRLQILKYEQGINRISAMTLYKISEALKLPLDAFYVDLEDVKLTAILYGSSLGEDSAKA